MSQAAPGPSSGKADGEARPARQPLAGDSLRWQAYFQRCDEPLFFLNRRQRVLFVNRAWEELTGLSAAEAQNLICSRARPANPGESFQTILAHALCPPPEVWQGHGGRSRRLLPGRPAAQRWWDVEFFPLRAGGQVLGILGRITAVPAIEPAGSAPLPEKLMALRQQVVQRWSLDLLTSELPVMRRLADQVRLASQVQVPVVLLGEAGTGKHTLARIIHHLGPQGDRALITLDCQRLPPFALAGWLFGSYGSSPGTVATVYLKEPGALPHDLQLRLCDLLAVQGSSPGPQPPRLLAGSTRPLAACGMLEELVCRLETLVLEVPPLRERRADLPLLVDTLLKRANAEEGPQVVGLTAAAWELVREYSWPGNLRELYAVLAAARTRAKNERIDAADLPGTLRLAPTLKETSHRKPGPPLPLDQLLEQAEKRLIELALRQAKGKKYRAAELLTIWRQRLVRRMEALGITDVEEGQDEKGTDS
jgi:transcriptional regulator with PAS, ATPase and Fis domain